ncbi:MAG: response regulator [Phycisphaerae bacterium]
MARVLAVDDQPHMTYIVATWLAENGHEVVRASDGAAALELLRAEPFDLLITDVDMPHMDGLSLLSHHEVMDRLVGIIVLTGRCDFQDLDASCCKEKIHLLPKPFSPSGLAQLVEGLIATEPSPSVTKDLVPTQ